jgi:wyosine [tRNA(Phe)-imidazoG37] synthetase (radical SAM superfamily)
MTTARRYQHVFGPVPSRRLGRSLGVDLVPFKTCNYDCIYCEQGRTTNHMNMRDEYIPWQDALGELRDYLEKHAAPDYITLSGCGEPTLHVRLGEMAKEIKSLTDIPLAVITNGSLLWDAEVRDALCAADVVMPSLDAGNAQIFEYVNRPAPGISFERMVTGLIEFRQSYQGAIWLEVLLLSGVTSGESEVREIARWASEIRPDRIQLNTVARPPAESYALPISRERLKFLAALFHIPAEVIADPADRGHDVETPPEAPRILVLVRRRPCSVQDIAEALGARLTETAKMLDVLVARHQVRERRFGNEAYFMAVTDGDEESTS